MAQQEVTVFLSEFESLKKKVSSHLSENCADTSLTTKALQDLTRFVSENASSIPGYELRKAHNVIIEFQTKIQCLEEKSRQGRKFKFVRKQPEIQTGSQPKTLLKTNEPSSQDSVREQTAPTLSNLVEEIIVLDSEKTTGKDLWLNKLEKTTVVIKGIPSALHLTNLEDCQIITGPIQTSIFMENCRRSVFALACQQLRLHKSEDCDLYLHISSRVIIEDCCRCRFAPYTREYSGKTEEFTSVNFDVSTNNWNLIDDFNWLSKESSPNWCLIPDNERTSWQT